MPTPENTPTHATTDRNISSWPARNGSSNSVPANGVPSSVVSDSDIEAALAGNRTDLVAGLTDSQFTTAMLRIIDQAAIADNRTDLVVGLTDSQFTIAMLRIIDQTEDITLSPGTIEFVASVLDQGFPLTPKQQDVCDRIIDEYWTDDMSDTFKGKYL